MIFMAAPGYAPNMVFAGAPSGDVYQSNQYGLIYVGSGGVPDQQFLMSAGCATLVPFSTAALPPQTGWKPAVTSNPFPTVMSGLTNGKLMSCRVHTTTMALSGLIRLTLLNIVNLGNVGDYWDNLGPQNMGPITVNGTICYPGADNVIGSYSAVVVAPGAMVDVFVSLSETIPGGAQFYEGCFAVPASGAQIPNFGLYYDAQPSQGPYTNGEYPNTALGEGSVLSTTATDQTANLSSISGTSSPSNTACFGASAICAVQPLTQPVVAVNADSLEAGFKGGTDALNNCGPVAWACSDLVPVLNCGCSGKVAAVDAGAAIGGTGYANAMTARLRFFQHCNATHFYNLLGTNDVNGGTATATIEGYLTTIADLAAGIGLVCIAGTLPPLTTSTDGWVTTTNQTVTANESKRTALNTWIRTTPAPHASYVEFCTAVESSPGSGLWTPNGTADGIHWGYNLTLLAAQQVNVSALNVTLPAQGVAYLDTYGLGVKTAQAGLDKLLGTDGATGVVTLSDANHSFNPYGEGKRFNDTGALTADRNVTLAISGGANSQSIPDGYEVRVSRFGASDAYHRKVYQSDGSTLIASIAAGAAGAFTWSAAAGAWFQSG